MKNYTISITSCGMGDVLLLTALCKRDHDCMVSLPSKSQRFSRFFRNICKEVIIDNGCGNTREEGIEGTIIERKLKYYGFNNGDCLPYVYLSEEDKIRGQEKIRQYKNPIAFVPNCASHWKKVREAPVVIWQEIIDYLSDKYTFLQFGVSSNMTRFKNTEPLMDLTIDDLICYYAAIGKYIGVDTGDMHLMLAVNGRCDVLVPPSSPEYLYSDWHYKSDRIKYVDFNEYDKLASLMSPS